MNSTELRHWIEQQEAIHGVLEIFCMTADGHVPGGEKLSVGQLAVTSQRMLSFTVEGVGIDETVIAIGCGDCEGDRYRRWQSQ